MKKFLDEDEYNPNFSSHHLHLNKVYMCIGPTGSGKSNFLANLIKQFDDTFEEIVIYTADVDEPIYRMLRASGVSIETHDKIKPLSELDSVRQKLVVFDDFLCVKKTKKDDIPNLIEEYSIRARKKQCTMIYLTQNYYSVPTKIRNQIRYLVVLKLTNAKNLSMIIQGLPIECSVQKLKAVINHATEKQFHVCIIDLTETNPQKCVRRNFVDYYDLS